LRRRGLLDEVADLGAIEIEARAPGERALGKRRAGRQRDEEGESERDIPYHEATSFRWE
jgi:hypothetical protein